MPGIPYPTASYPNDPLEIPIDTMTSIEMEIYHPGLITHQAESGDQFFLKRGTPRWRGNVRWAACYTNSERAGAIEGYLASLSQGLNTSTLKHGRVVADISSLMRRTTVPGPGLASIPAPQMMDDPLPTPIPGEVFKPTTGDYAGRLFMITSVNGAEITFTPRIEIFGDDASVTLDQTEANKMLSVRATPGSTFSLARNRTLSGPWSMSWIEEV